MSGSLTRTMPERALVVRRAAARLCRSLSWAPLHEMPLPNGRRADIMALRPDGGFVCIEVKSGARDFLTDAKWPEYRDFCDALYFAVDTEFPPELLLSLDTGVMIADSVEAMISRPAPAHPLDPARRRALLHRFAALAAERLAVLEDPAGTLALRTALRAD